MWWRKKTPHYLSEEYIAARRAEEVAYAEWLRELCAGCGHKRGAHDRRCGECDPASLLPFDRMVTVVATAEYLAEARVATHQFVEPQCCPHRGAAQ